MEVKTSSSTSGSSSSESWITRSQLIEMLSWMRSDKKASLSARCDVTRVHVMISAVHIMGILK